MKVDKQLAEKLRRSVDRHRRFHRPTSPAIGMDHDSVLSYSSYLIDHLTDFEHQSTGVAHNVHR